MQPNAVRAMGIGRRASPAGQPPGHLESKDGAENKSRLVLPRRTASPNKAFGCPMAAKKLIERCRAPPRSCRRTAAGSTKVPTPLVLLYDVESPPAMS